MAGGSLVTKLRKGFQEFTAAGLVTGGAPRIFGAQAAGCAPIVRLVRENADAVEPVVPRTIARSIAIGNPADGLFAKRAIVESGGWAAAVSDPDIVAGIRLLAEETGIFTETAGGVTVAAALALAAEGRLQPEDEVVVCITGNGLKTTDAVAPALAAAPLIAPRLSDVRALVAKAGA
jgi:threonine synthase